MYTAEIITIKSMFMLQVSSQLTFEVYMFRLLPLALCGSLETPFGRDSHLKSYIKLDVLSSW